MEQNSNIVESPGAYYPQDYSLKTLNLLTASGQRFELKKLLVELSYYEDLYSFVTSGYITLIDAQGFIELLQLTGNEFIEINFGKVKGGSNDNNQVFRVYKIGNRVPSGNMNSEVYTLHFCSEELLLSEQNKISKSFKSTKISDIINNILTDKLKVPANRIENIEETSGVYDFIVPKIKPFEAVSWLSNYARPKATGAFGADMLFFETKNGFNFRSLQSMFKSEIYGTYKHEVKNLGDSIQDFQEKTVNVLDYQVSKPYDILNEINTGTFANQLMSIDPLARKVNVTNFDYSKFKTQAQTLNKGAPANNLKNRLGKKETESYEGTLKLAFSNSIQQNVPYIKEQGGVAKDIFIESYVPNRTAQISLANYTTIKAAIPGDPGITVGRTIQFNLLSMKPSMQKELDSFYSGKYLVTAARHVVTAAGVYQTILELSKDSAPTNYQNINNDSTEWKKAVSE